MRDGAADFLVSNLAPVTKCRLTDEREQKADENSLNEMSVFSSKIKEDERKPLTLTAASQKPRYRGVVLE